MTLRLNLKIKNITIGQKLRLVEIMEKELRQLIDGSKPEEVYFDGDVRKKKLWFRIFWSWDC